MVKPEIETYGARSVLALLDLDGAAPRLPPSEQHVLMLLLDGCDNRSIAAARGTSMRTVANQVTNLFRRFKLGSRAELAARAARFVQREIHQDWLARRAASTSLEPLQPTPRQRLALELRARGHSVKFISFELGVAESTTSNELKRGMRALDIRSSLELCAVFGQTNAQAAA